MRRRPPRSTQSRSSAASDVYKRQEPSGDAPTAELGPRKLIRPSLAHVLRDQGVSRGPSSRKMVPPEQTNAEAYYYLKQMQSKTPIVVRLVDGEELRGWIEWYDNCL